MPRFWIRIPHRFNRMHRANDTDDVNRDVKESRLCMIGAIMVIYGICVLLFIIPKAYVIKNYSSDNDTALSEWKLAKDDDKYSKVEFEKSGHEEEMSILKFGKFIKKAKPRERREITKEEINTFWPQNVNNVVENKYGRKKDIKLFKKTIHEKIKEIKLSAEENSNRYLRKIKQLRRK